MQDTDIVIKPRDVMPEGATTLPAEYYVSQEFFARELERLFGRMWICAGREEQVARPGQFFVREVMGESVIVTRGAGGRVNAFYNVCRHRGTKLCTEHEGAFAGSIQCPYHAWTYDLDGRLVGAPHMDEVPHFRKQDYPLHRVHSDVWDGHVFLNLSETPSATLLEQLGPLPEKFRPWRMQDLRLGHRIVYDVRANWKLVIQNYNECLHCPNLHPALNKLSHYLSGENEPLQATYMGGRMDLRPGVETMSTRRELPAGVPAGAVWRGRAARLLLRDLPEHAPQPAPRLHDGAHAVADRARPHDQHLRVALPPGRDREARVRPEGRGGVLGHDEPAGLARLRAVAGRHLVARLQARAVLEPRGSALRVRQDDRGAARSTVGLSPVTLHETRGTQEIRRSEDPK
jgi:nitrite reductase/ring-hydroxylating ferredoxin subunit